MMEVFFFLKEEIALCNFFIYFFPLTATLSTHNNLLTGDILRLSPPEGLIWFDRLCKRRSSSVLL